MYQDESEYKLKRSTNVATQKILFALVLILLFALAFNYHQQEIAELQAQNETKELTIAELQSQISSSDAEIAELQAEIAELQNQLAERDPSIASLQSTIANQEEQISELEAEIAIKDEQISNLQSQSTRIDNPVTDTERLFGYVIANMCNPIPVGQASRSNFPNIMVMPMNAVIIEANSTTISRFYAGLPDDWTATFQNNTDLVLCVSMSSQKLEECPYQEGTIDRIQEVADIVVLNVLNQAWLGTEHILGAIPATCPDTFPQDLQNNAIVGEISSEAFNRKISFYINGG